MPLVIPQGFAQAAVEIRHENDPDPWYITFGIEVTAAGGDWENVADKCMASFHSGFQATLSPDVNITACILTVGQDAAEPLRIYRASEVDRGGTANDARLPQNCALLVRKNTILGGRRNRGRFFVPGVLAEGAVSSVGIIDSSAVNTYQGYVNGFWTMLNGTAGGFAEPLPMVILHSTGGSAVPEPTPVTSLSVDNLISTQRRRLR